MQTDPLRRTRIVATDERIAPIEQHALGEQVYRAIREQIISGRLRPGEKLSDLRLSDALHVSRTPVRDYPMILAMVLLIAFLWGTTYLLTDICYALLDPRIRLTGR